MTDHQPSEYSYARENPQWQRDPRVISAYPVVLKAKESHIAYLLAIFLGGLGMHRFYLHRNGSALAQLIMSLTIICIPVTAFWVLVDLFLIPNMIREENRKIGL